MANLRVDKITTGTANYQGSIYASGAGAYLLTKTTAPGTDDFTIEFWINSNDAAGGSQEGVFGINAQAGGFQGGTGNQIRLSQGRYGGGGTNGGLEVDINGTSVGTGNGNDIIQEGTWYHVAVTRASGTVKIWVDGVEKASGSAAGNVTGTTFVTGYYDSNYTFQGYMSNFRYRKGTAYYTTTFTPPTGPLERTSDTELIFAQSVNNAGNGYSSAIHGGTTDIMQVFGNVTANTQAPILTTSSSVGVVFEEDAKINSKNYMYFPTGDTTQRSRGRAVIFGGVTTTPNYLSSISYYNISNFSSAHDFGDMGAAGGWMTACSSSTRGLAIGAANGGGATNVVEYVEIATTGNTKDFGDLTEEKNYYGAASNQTRALRAGGYGTGSDVIDYGQIANPGNFVDFGNLTQGRLTHEGGLSSPTRAVWGGGTFYNPNVIYHNIIDYITIATTGNATDFGDMTVSRKAMAAVSSSTRGIWSGGYTPTYQNVKDYITIPTTGNATDFGDSLWTGAYKSGTSNGTRGVWSGGRSPGGNANRSNLIEHVTIATTGDGTDFGDLDVRRDGPGACSDSHGGL